MVVLTVYEVQRHHRHVFLPICASGITNCSLCTTQAIPICAVDREDGEGDGGRLEVGVGSTSCPEEVTQLPTGLGDVGTHSLQASAATTIPFDCSPRSQYRAGNARDRSTDIFARMPMGSEAACYRQD